MNTLLEWLRDLLTILTWKEFWIVLSVPTAMLGVLLLFSFIVSFPNNIVRTIGTWSLIFALTLGAAVVDELKRQQSKV